MYYKAHDVLRKAGKHKSGGYKTILERWHDDDKYRKSFSDVGWAEEHIIQYDASPLEDHATLLHDKKEVGTQNLRKCF